MKKSVLGLIVTILVLTIAGCGTSTSSAPFRGNVQHTGVFNSSISRINGVSWKFPVEYIDSDPVIENGTVYFGTSSINLKDQHMSFYALDADTGAKRWQFQIPEAVHTSSVVQNNTVFFTGYNNITNSGHLYALDTKKGDKKWSFKTGSEGTGPVYSNGTVYFGAKDAASSSFNVYALDSQTGKEKWKFDCEGSTTQTPVYSDSTIYFGVNKDNSITIYAIDANNCKNKWKTSLSDKRLQTELSFADGLLYIGLLDSRDRNLTGYVYSIDSKTGETKIIFQEQGFINNLAVYNNTLFLSIHTNNNESTDGFYALDSKTGQQKWDFKPEVSGIAGASISNGTVYLADLKNLYAIDPKTGEENWRFAIDHIWSDPVIANGKVYASLESSLIALH